MKRINVKDYLEKREMIIDKTEWYDILSFLIGMGAKENDKIIELCAGKGLLIDFLIKYGFKNIQGIDLWCEHPRIICLDLNKLDYLKNNKALPHGDWYISQHCLEHLNQKKVVEMIEFIFRKTNARAMINIVPGHLTYDPTHIITYYTYGMLMDIVSKIRNKGIELYYYIQPDLHSFFVPQDHDWLFILSRIPIKRKYSVYPLTKRIAIYLNIISRRLWVSKL